MNSDDNSGLIDAHQHIYETLRKKFGPEEIDDTDATRRRVKSSAIRDRLDYTLGPLRYSFNIFHSYGIFTTALTLHLPSLELYPASIQVARCGMGSTPDESFAAAAYEFGVGDYLTPNCFPSLMNGARPAATSQQERQDDRRDDRRENRRDDRSRERDDERDDRRDDRPRGEGGCVRLDLPERPKGGFWGFLQDIEKEYDIKAVSIATGWAKKNKIEGQIKDWSRADMKRCLAHLESKINEGSN